MPRPDHSLPTAIILHPNDGALTMARVLAARGVRVHALADGAVGRAFATSRAVTGHRLPDLPDGADAWIARLESIAGEGPGVLLSGSDHATRFLFTHRRRIPALLCSFEAADGPHARVMDKSSLYAIAEAAGVRAPRTQRARTEQELHDAAEQVTYPCVLKPANIHYGEIVGQKTKRVDRPADVLEHGARPVGTGLEMLLSELVPGPESNLEGAVTVRLADGSYPLAYGRRKLRQWPLDYGAAALMVAEEVPETMGLAHILLDACGFIGVSSLETKRHAVTGEVVLIEINVRLPQSFGLSKACEVDGPWRVYAALAGLPLDPQPAPRIGRKVVVPPLERRAATARIRRGELTWRAALGSYRGVRSVGLLNPSDPLPALAFAAAGARQRLSALHGRSAAPRATAGSG